MCVCVCVCVMCVCVCVVLLGIFFAGVGGEGCLFVCLLACFLAFCPAAISREGTATRNAGRRWTDLPVVAEQPEPFQFSHGDVRQITDGHTEQPCAACAAEREAPVKSVV